MGLPVLSGSHGARTSTDAAVPPAEYDPSWYDPDEGPPMFLIVREPWAIALMAGHVPEPVAQMCRNMIESRPQTGAVDYVGRREAQQRQAPRRQKKKGTR